MDKQELENILCYIVKQGLETIKANTENVEATIDYVAILQKIKASSIPLIPLPGQLETK